MRQTVRAIASFEDIDAIVAQAHQGVPSAMRQVSVLIASGIGTPIDWSAALAWSQAAAERGDDEAQSELILISADQDFRGHLTDLARSGAAFPADTWRRLASTVDLAALTRPNIGQVVCEDPLIARVPDMASPGLCTWLMTKARPELQRAKVLRPHHSEVEFNEARTNSMVEYDLATSGLPLVALRQKIAALVELPLDQLEPTNLLHYAPGEQFTAHFDSFGSGEAVVNASFAAYGQRLITLLIYLNEDYEGGETDFPNLNWRFRGQTGEALFWRNTDDEGEVHRGSFHAGLPPTSGSKWILSQWIRERSCIGLG